MKARIMLTIEREVEVSTYTGYKGLNVAEGLVEKQAKARLGPKYEVLRYWAEDVTDYRYGLKSKKLRRGKVHRG